MKLTIYILISLLFASSLNAQNNSQSIDESDIPSKIENSIFFPQKQDTWLLDSVFTFDNTINNIGIDWHYLYKTKVLERNTAGFPVIIEYSSNDFVNNESVINGYTNYYYPNPSDTIEYSLVRSRQFDDNGIIENYFRKTINYDDDGYYSETSDNWANETWVDGRKTVYGETDSDFHLLKYKRDTEENDWELYEKWYTYFSEDSLTSYRITEKLFESEMIKVNELITNYNSFYLPELYEIRRLSSTNGWLNDSKSILEYDERQNLIFTEVFNGNHDQWENDYQYIYNYDENNYLSSRIQLRWKDQGYWDFRSRHDYVNDESGNVVIDYTFDDIGDSLWIYSNKVEYTYNTINQITSNLRSLYHPENESWTNNRKQDYFYENGLITLYINQAWDSLSSTWLESSHNIYEYDDEGRLILELSEQKDSTYQYWIPNFKSVYSYPEEESQKQYIVHHLKYMAEEGIWENTYMGIKYYNKYLTKISQLPLNTFKLYPNPSSEFIIIESDIYHSQKTTYEVYDIQGRIVDSGKYSPDGMIKINHLTNGQYFVKIYNPEGKALSLSFVKY